MGCYVRNVQQFLRCHNRTLLTYFICSKWRSSGTHLTKSSLILLEYMAGRRWRTEHAHYNNQRERCREECDKDVEAVRERDLGRQHLSLRYVKLQSMKDVSHGVTVKDRILHTRGYDAIRVSRCRSLEVVIFSNKGGQCKVCGRCMTARWRESRSSDIERIG